MNIDRGSLLAILLCILFYIIYSQYLSSKYPPQPRRVPTDAQQDAGNVHQPRDEATREQSIAAASKAEQPRDYQTLSVEQQTFSNDEIVWRFDPRIGGFTSISLRQYRQGVAPDAAQVDLVSEPLFIQGIVGKQPSRSAPGTAFDRSLAPRKGRGYLQARREGRTLLAWYEQDGWRITHEFGFPERGYGLDMLVRFKNITAQNRELNAGLLFVQRVDYGEQTSSFIPVIPLERTQIIAKLRNEVDWHDLQGYCDDVDEELRTSNSQLDLLGLDRHYFLGVLLTDMARANFIAEPLTRERNACDIALLAWQKQGLVGAQQQVLLPLRGYFGPKALEDMESYDQRLGGTLDFGWFGVISLPLLATVKWLYKFVGNYGIAIILLTIFIKLLFYPLTRSSVRSMQGMKKLQPQMTAIRARHKDDPKRQQQELMKFMSTNKVNPMKGCLPILPQIPVFFAFYRVLSTSIELRHAPFFAWITDLSAKDPYYVTPLLLGVCMFAQQKLTPMTGMDKNQQKIMMLMPVVFTLMMLSLPSGMVIYMLANTVVSIMQQQWLNRKFA